MLFGSTSQESTYLQHLSQSQLLNHESVVWSISISISICTPGEQGVFPKNCQDTSPGRGKTTGKRAPSSNALELLSGGFNIPPAVRTSRMGTSMTGRTTSSVPTVCHWHNGVAVSDCHADETNMILTSHVRIFQCSDNWMKQMLLNGTPLSLKLKMAQRCKDNTWNRFKQIIYTQYIQTLNLHHLAPSNPKGFRRACLLCASKPLALHQGTPTHSSPVPSANHLWFDTGDGFFKKEMGESTQQV